MRGDERGRRTKLRSRSREGKETDGEIGRERQREIGKKERGTGQNWGQGIERKEEERESGHKYREERTRGERQRRREDRRRWERDGQRGGKKDR